MCCGCLDPLDDTRTIHGCNERFDKCNTIAKLAGMTISRHKTAAAGLLTVSQAATELNLSTGRVRQLLLDENSGLTGFKIGHGWMIDRADLDEFRKLDRKPGNPRFRKKT